MRKGTTRDILQKIVFLAWIDSSMFADSESNGASFMKNLMILITSQVMIIFMHLDRHIHFSENVHFLNKIYINLYAPK